MVWHSIDHVSFGRRSCFDESSQNLGQPVSLLLVGLVFRVVPRTGLQVISLGFVSAAEIVVSKTVSKWSQPVSVDALTVFWMVVDDENPFDASETMLTPSLAWGACLESKVHRAVADSHHFGNCDISGNGRLALCRSTAMCSRIYRK